jgi:hypothetical protein
MKICLEAHPEEIPISDTHSAACWVNVRQALEEEGKLEAGGEGETQGGEVL